MVQPTTGLLRLVSPSPGFALLTGGYAHLATPWQRTYSPIFQLFVLLSGRNTSWKDNVDILPLQGAYWFLLSIDPRRYH